MTRSQYLCLLALDKSNDDSICNRLIIVKRKSKTDTADSVKTKKNYEVINKMKNNNELQKHKSRDMVKWIIVFVSIIMLATMLSAIITNGFKTVNPYGWLENFDRIKKDTELNGFEVCKDFGLDFAKLIKGVKATEDTVAGTKTYAIVKTDNENVYINVVETIANEKSSYTLVINGQNVCTSADGFNDTAIEAIKSCDTCKVTEVQNAGRLAHYVGATFVKAEQPQA